MKWVRVAVIRAPRRGRRCYRHLRTARTGGRNAQARDQLIQFKIKPEYPKSP